MKKNNKGMTLVEVVVAMAVFSTMTLAIAMAFAAAIKYNTRNIRRDYELTLQQEAVQKTSASGIEVFNGDYGSHKLIFKDTSGTELFKLENVTEYNAIKSAQNGSDFNFELKTFSSVPLGATSCNYSKDAKQYKISIVNETTFPVDIIINTTGGTIYEGDPQTGYRHSSNLYRRSILGRNETGTADEFETVDEEGNTTLTSPQGFIIGFDNEGDVGFDTADSYMTIQFNVGGFAFPFSFDVSNAALASSANGHLELTIKMDPSNPTQPLIAPNYNAPA